MRRCRPDPSRRSPPSLVLVVIQTLVVGFGALRFAGRIRLQQSTSQGVCTAAILYLSRTTQVVSRSQQHVLP